MIWFVVSNCNRQSRKRDAVLQEVAFETDLPALDIFGFEPVVFGRSGQFVSPPVKTDELE